ncbi:MAG: flagellar biosynthesis repressor FlbT [Alsobacter sp.]
MPLKIELKPFERLIIGGASIRNGDRRSSFILETNTRFLREADIIVEQDANTPCKRLYVALEFVYLSDDPSDPENIFVSLANELMQAAPSTGPYIMRIHDCLSKKEFYQALKVGKELIAYEEELLARAVPAGTPAKVDEAKAEDAKG